MLILTVIKGPDQGRRFELPDDEPQSIGRSSESLPLVDKSISRCHAELTPDDGKWLLRDLGSANGTFVNGVRVKGHQQLHPGDQIRTGSTILMYGKDPRPVRTRRHRGVQVAKKDEMEVNVERAVSANPGDSMILAVPEPSEAAMKHLQVIYELTQLIGSVIDREQLLERVMDVVFDHFQADRGFILLQEKPDQRPDPVVIRRRVTPQHQEDDEPIVISRTIVQHVLRKNEAVLSSNAMTDKRFATGDSVHRMGIRSAMCVPMKFKDRIFGVIHVDSRVANYTYTEDQLLLLTAIGVQTGLALANIDLYQSRLQAERLGAAGRTVASLSHSIKNILQGLRGGADVMELGMRKGKLETVKAGWDITSRNLDRIYALTMNMLAFSKQRQPELEMTNVTRLLEEIVELVQKQYDAKKVALITELDEAMPPVPMDPGGIHQAMLNLLNNALEAVQPGDGAVTVSCAFDDETDPPLVRIRVADNGEGIEPARMAKLFEPFHSTKGQRGTGLGLVVTKKIVTEHGGQIHVDSQLHQGATFTIELPTAPVAARASGDTTEPDASTETMWTS